MIAGQTDGWTKANQWMDGRTESTYPYIPRLFPPVRRKPARVTTRKLRQLCNQDNRFPEYLMKTPRWISVFHQPSQRREENNPSSMWGANLLPYGEPRFMNRTLLQQKKEKKIVDLLSEGGRLECSFIFLIMKSYVAPLSLSAHFWTVNTKQLICFPLFPGILENWWTETLSFFFTICKH